MHEVAPATGNHQQDRLLEAVGLSDGEERSYTLLIDQPGSTLTEVAGLLHVGRGRARVILDSLIHRGLVTRTPDKTPRYLPAPPDVAVEALIAQRQQALERVRETAARLSQRARSRSETHTQLAEIISGSDAVAARIDQVLREAEGDITALIRPPLPFDVLSGGDSKLAAIERGVRFRMVYDRETLASPAEIEPVSRAIDAGELARVHPYIPATVIIADRRIGLVPLDVNDPEAGWLMLRPSAVLTVLMTFVNNTWENAAPLRLTAADDLEGTEPPASETEHHRLLLELMSAGLRDDAIAGHLDVSQRTIDRRIRSVMTELRATTRFQAGWLAAQQAMESTAKPKGRTKKS